MRGSESLSGPQLVLVRPQYFREHEDEERHDYEACVHEEDVPPPVLGVVRPAAGQPPYYCESGAEQRRDDEVGEDELEPPCRRRLVHGMRSEDELYENREPEDREGRGEEVRAELVGQVESESHEREDGDQERFLVKPQALHRKVRPAYIPRIQRHQHNDSYEEMNLVEHACLLSARVGKS